MPTVSFDSNSDRIWAVMSQFIGNDYGTAGLMGNIWAESGWKPDNMENVGTQFGWTDASYTQAVNDGTESFTRIYHIPRGDGTYQDRCLGYGICQWTSAGRKQGLYNLKQSQGVLIQNIDMQLDWLKYELSNGYSHVLTALQSAPSVRVASDYVLEHFERPGGWDTPAVQELRADYGTQVYLHYNGSPPPTPPTPGSCDYRLVIGKFRHKRKNAVSRFKYKR